MLKKNKDGPGVTAGLARVVVVVARFAAALPACPQPRSPRPRIHTVRQPDRRRVSLTFRFGRAARAAQLKQ